MKLRRHGAFRGGIDLPDEKQATEDLPIRACPGPARLRLPLAPCGGPAAEPAVEVGQQVTVGERLAQAAAPNGVDVFAPLSGQVAAITHADIALLDAFAPVPAVELVDLSPCGPIQPLRPTFDWRAASAETLRLRIAEGGLTTYAHRPVPLAAFIDAARRKGCQTLVANAMESQPYVTADHRLLVEHGTEVIRGLTILAQVMEIGEMILAVDQRRTDDYRGLVGAARSYGIDRVALTYKYPVGAEPILVHVLTRREMPPGGSTMDLGVVVVSAATCFAAYHWTACGMPPTARIVTVSGERAHPPGNYWVPFGTSCLELAGEAPPPVIHGGPMVGARCGADAVVGPATDAVLAIDAAPVTPPSPCIRCGWCTDHCPARLNVAALNDAFELGQVDRAQRLVAAACVECGVCSYVCPARLPLSQRVKQLKHAIRTRTQSQAIPTTGDKPTHD